jgi:hypothetical protein
VSSELGVAHDAAVTEWIRVWAYELPAYEREGWRFSHAILGGPGEQIYGPGHRDCWLMRKMDPNE